MENHNLTGTSIIFNYHWAIFNSYVKLLEGIPFIKLYQVFFVITVVSRLIARKHAQVYSCSTLCQLVN